MEEAQPVLSDPGPAPTGHVGRRWLLFLSGLGIGGLLVWAVVVRDPVFSDPLTARQPDPLTGLLAPPKAAPVVDTSPLEHLEVIWANDNQLRITLPDPAGTLGEDLYDYTLHTVEAGTPLRVDEGEIRVEHLAVAYGTFTGGPGDYSQEIPARFFDGALREMTGNEVQRRFKAWERNLNYHGECPRVRFGLATEGLGEVKLLKARLYDARTLVSLCSGYSSRTEQNRLQIEADVALWHPTPLLLVLDVAHGPQTETTLPPESGTVIEHPLGALHLVSVVDGESRNWGSHSLNNMQELTFTLENNAEPPHTTFIFLGIPKAHPVALDIGFLDRQARKLPGGESGSSERFKIASTPTARTDITALQIRQYTRLKRLVIELPEIPGLPEANRAVRNLFDVQIPHLRVSEPFRLKSILEQLVQMHVSSGTTASPAPWSFPRFYTNATPRDLLNDLYRLQPPGTILKVDPETNIIRSEPPAWKRWLTKVKSFF